MMKTVLGLAAGALMIAGGANAATFLHSQTVKEDNDRLELSADFSFNDVTETFGLSFDFRDDYMIAGPGGRDPLDGAWWVVNNGGEPFGGATSTSAIMYTDLTNVWAYEYRGSRKRSDPDAATDLLAYYSGAVSSSSNGDGTTKFSMSLDVSGLNNLSDPSLPADWAGTQFDENIGTWLHGTYGAFTDCDGSTTAKTNSATALNCFNGSQWNGWDVKTAQTELAPVPVPGSLGLAAAPLALLGFGAWRRRKATAKA